jgi:hydroxyacylglutathione hydrolase
VRIERDVYLVGSGTMGFDMTDPYDCNIFLFNGGDSCALFDTGAGMGTEQILHTCSEDGIDPDHIDHLFLTHAHADHGGGTAHLRDHIDVAVYASEATAKIVETGDEAAVSLDAAKKGGIYPADYVYRSSTVEHVLEGGDSVAVGEVKVELIRTPGHSHDHCSYLVTVNDKAYLVGGDAIFFGGKVVLQKTYDCSVPQTISSIEHLGEYSFEALLPGHLNFSLKNGKRHIDTALAITDRFGCPPSIT